MNSLIGKSDHLFEAFEKSARQYPERPALEVNQRTYSYAGLHRMATQIAALIRQNGRDGQGVAAFLAYRSITGYAAALGILGSGKGYVPLHPQFPVERTNSMLMLSGAETLIVGSEAFPLLGELLAKTTRSLTVICPDMADLGNLPEEFPRHNFLSEHDVAAAKCYLPADVTRSDTAYLLFTSGSTGVPKGVPVSQRNVGHYLRYVTERYSVRAEDRFSQMFDMTFDLSVHDMFVSWSNGACLYCVPHSHLISPSRFIREKQLTMWFSVPSVIMFMQKTRTLKPNSLPSLRFSLFCGEPLLETMAQAWQEAAPASELENLYGPTEATIAITHYRWKRNSDNRCVNGIVPIGNVFAGNRTCLVDTAGGPKRDGETGELCLGGPQVTRGYLNNEEKTRDRFVRITGGAETWYKTGDLASEDSDCCLHYVGRTDNQVQVCGHRVELQEIDHTLRVAAQTDMAVSVAWPIDSGHADAVYGFICGEGPDLEQISAECRKVMPEYMVPRKIFLIDEMPLNVNGKIDRNALARRVGELLHEN